MELTTAKGRTIIPQTEQCENLPLTLVGELLETILTDDKEEIRVEAGSQHFLYDTKTGVQVGNSLKASVLEVKVKQQDSSIEINLSGTIETMVGFQQTCNLYLFLWWDHTQTSPLKSHGPQQLKPMSLLIHPPDFSEYLSDSVFELDLYRQKIFQQQEYLGQGRGYLVFGRTHQDKRQANDALQF